MTLCGMVGKWERSTSMVFPDTSSHYILPLAFTALAIYRETDVAAYVEPNI